VLSGFSLATVGKTPPKGSTKAKPVTIKLTGSTTYTTSQATTASALAVGDCVTAAGSTATTGAVTASTIRIMSTGGKSCTSGFPGAATGG
jgi:hypothetical protein